MPSLHAVVHGRVQGVGFRDFVRRRAASLRLAGHVRNLADGSVEVHAEGPDAALDALLDLLREGPVGSRVTRVDAERHPGDTALTEFRVLG
jgi:acylphosphatase